MIEVKNLYKSFQKKYLYYDFNISFQSGRITSIIGPSGCGKTTFLRMLAGLEPYEKGTVEGIDHSRLSFVFQEDRLLPWLTVYENIELVIKTKRSLSNEKDKEIKKSIAEILSLLKLTQFENLFPLELSGGMQRRVAIGRALVYDLTVDGDLMILDEPFKGLDTKLKDEIIVKLMEIWKDYQRTVILVTHDLEDAKKISDKIYTFSELPVQWKLLTESD